MLDSKVKIDTPLGTISDKNEYSKQSLILNTWFHSLLYAKIQVHPCGVRMFTAKSQSSYRVKMKNDYSIDYQLSFEADVKLEDDLSARMTRIQIGLEFAQKEHQAKVNPNILSSEIVFHILGMVERNEIDTQSYAACFAPNFELLTLKSEKIDTLEKVVDWVKRVNSKWNKLLLNPTNIEVTKVTSDEIHVSFDLVMEGINPDGTNKISLTKNNWILSKSNQDADFATLKSVRAEKLDAIFI